MTSMINIQKNYRSAPDQCWVTDDGPFEPKNGMPVVFTTTGIPFLGSVFYSLTKTLDQFLLHLLKLFLGDNALLLEVSNFAQF